jgi:AraC family transcriptional regulator of arabinose operon
MHIRSIGVNHSHGPDFIKDRPNGTGEYILLLVKTKAVFRFGENEIHTRPDSLIVYRKGSPQYFRADNGTFVNDWICFDVEEGESSFFDGVEIKLDTIYEVKDSVSLSSLIKILFQEYLSDGVHKSEVISGYLKILFYKISECISAQNRNWSFYGAKLDGLRSMIYSDPRVKRTVAELAEKTGLSESQFQRLYKSRFGVSPIADTVAARIEYAKYLLASTDHTVSRISEELNYKSDIQFIQQFKSIVKTTPSKYRRSI